MHVSCQLTLSMVLWVLLEFTRTYAVLVLHASCIHIRGNPELAFLFTDAHQAVVLLDNFRLNGTPVTIGKSMLCENLHASLRYACHGSSMHNAEFLHKDMAESTSMGHVFLIPWRAIYALLSLWLITLGIITHEGLHPRLVYDSICHKIQASVPRKALAEAMHFFQSLPCLLCCIICAYPQMGTSFSLQSEYLQLHT